MEKVLSNGRLWTITGAGHGVMADNPGDSLTRYIPFFRNCGYDYRSEFRQAPVRRIKMADSTTKFDFS